MLTIISNGLGHSELTNLREKAEHLRDGILRSRGDALLPLSLATFIFEALISASAGIASGRPSFCSTYRLPTDETLGFEAAVAALGLKVISIERLHWPTRILCLSFVSQFRTTLLC